MPFLKDLNPVQRDAVQAVDGPVMIVAGAGSGKTRVLTYRAAHLIHLGVRPESILALTFTNKAADEMKARIVSLVGEKSRALWMGTFHSIFARILRMECEAIGYQRNFTIYDTDDSLSLIKRIMNELEISQQQFSPQGIRARISIAKNGMVSPAQYPEQGIDAMTERTAHVYEAYEREIARSNAMDFDDLLLKPLELFTRHPDILTKYQYRFKYILVDEYQDTNRVQYKLIKEMARLQRNVCVVGDDAQSIYSFRGADIRNILDFEKDYPDCKIFRLEQNYRSTKTILATADALISHNTRQIPKKLWTDNAEGEPVVLTACEDDREEGYKIVELIEEESRKKKLDLKDFAVLYRTNAQSRSIEDALRRSGIPYVIVGGVAFYKRKEIKDILAYLKVIANPLDTESLLRIINVPPRAIGETTIGRIKACAAEHKLSLFDTLASPFLADLLADRVLKAVRNFHTSLKKYIALKAEMSVSELARAVVDEIGVLVNLKEENTPESLARRDNIQELISALSEFNDHRPGARLEEFLEEVSLVSDVDMADFSHNAVTLMTLHAAKGLEYPVVFVTGLEEGLFPLGSAAEDAGELEEERRLMYVGITRARQKLFLLFAKTRYRFGELSFSSRSRFLDELNGNLVELNSGRTIAAGRAYRRHLQGSGTPKISRPAEPRPPQGQSAGFYADTTPNYEDESQEVVQLRVGARVIHDAFGSGKIIALDGRGDNARAIVDFDSVGRKHLMLKFAHLRGQ